MNEQRVARVRAEMQAHGLTQMIISDCHSTLFESQFIPFRQILPSCSKSFHFIISQSGALVKSQSAPFGRTLQKSSPNNPDCLFCQENDWRFPLFLLFTFTTIVTTTGSRYSPAYSSAEPTITFGCASNLVFSPSRSRTSRY